MMRQFLRLRQILSLLLLVGSCLGADFSGKVVGITDGDTIRVIHDGAAERIRLWGIDCPESKRAFGTRAKAVHRGSDVRQSRDYEGIS